MLNRLKIIGLIFAFLGSFQLAWSQSPPGTDTLANDGFIQDVFQDPGKFEVQYFYADQPRRLYDYSDTLLNNYFQQPQPSRQRALERINLGNLGSPEQDLIFHPNFRQGFAMGFNQFDGYRISAEELRFYKIEHSFTDAAFSQGRSQDDQFIRAVFSRNFGKDVNFSIDYNRINHLGVFKNQKSQNTALAAGFWYHHPNDSYDGYLTIVTNTNFQGDNGGVDLTTLNEVNQTSEETVPVKLESTVSAARGNTPDAAAQTRYQTQEIAYTHYFTIGGPRPKRPKKLPQPPPITIDSTSQDSLPPPDSLRLDSLSLPQDTLLMDSLSTSDTLALLGDTLQIKPEKIRKPWKREFRVFHKISYNSSWYKFSDVSLAADSSFYGNYQVHNQGLRYYTEARTLQNTFRIGTSRKDLGDRKQRGRFEVGLMHRLINLGQDPIGNRTLNDLFLTGNWDYAPTPQLQLKTYAHYSLWNNVGDYYVGGDLTIDFGKIGTLQAKAVQQLYAPTVVQSGMYINNTTIWENDFKKTFETTLAATFENQRWRTKVSGQYHLLNNYIYFDTLALAQQTGLGISIPQVIIQQDFKWKNLHLDNVFVWQLSSQPAILPLPNLYGKHSLFLEGKIFKKVMMARFGIDLRWYSEYFPNTYQHLFGQFHLQNTDQLGLYPLADVFFSMKVRTLRAFIKGENFTKLFFPNDLIYDTPEYPIPYFGLRFGLSWIFMN